MAERKAVIKNADMAENMQQDAVECATQVWNIIFRTLQDRNGLTNYLDSTFRFM